MHVFTIVHKKCHAIHDTTKHKNCTRENETKTYNKTDFITSVFVRKSMLNIENRDVSFLMLLIHFFIKNSYFIECLSLLIFEIIIN